MLQDLFEIIVAYYQYLANILQTKGVNFSVAWVSSGQGLSITTLDIVFFQNYIPAIARDARVFFIIVSIILPLALIFLGLLAFNEPNVVVWYFVLLTSTFTLIAGVAAAIISSTVGLSISINTAYVLMGAGAGGLLLCSVLLICYRLNKDIDEEDMAELAEEQREAEKAAAEELASQKKIVSKNDFSLGKDSSADFKLTVTQRPKSLKHRITKKVLFIKQTSHFKCFPFVQGLLFALLCGAVGVILVLGTSTVGFSLDGNLSAFAWAIGITLIGIAALVLLWTLPSVALRGRQIKWYISSAMQENGMRFLILLIMILYIPIGSSSIAIFNCNDFSCPDGYRLIDQGTAYLFNTTNQQGINSGPNPYCIPCSVNASLQRASPASIAAACRRSPDSRLESSPDTTCAAIQRFFWPAAALALCFVVGAPFMFLVLIRRGTSMLKEDFPIDPRIEDWEMIWETKIVESQSVSKFLYQPFEYKYRYWRLLQIFQKLAIVITGTYVFRTPWSDVSSSTISLAAALFIHVVMSIAYFITEPFIRLYDDGVCTVLHWFLVSCVTIAILVLYNYVPPDEFNLAIIIVYLATPVILFLIGVRLEYKWSKEAEEKAEDDQRVRVVEHMQRMDSKAMRAAIAARKQKLADAANPLLSPAGGGDEQQPTEQPATEAFAVDEEENEEPEAARPMTALDGTAANAKALAERAAIGRDSGHHRPVFERPSTKSAPRSPQDAMNRSMSMSMSSSQHRSFRSSGMVRPGTTTESRVGPGGEGEAPMLALARVGTASRFSMKEALARVNSVAFVADEDETPSTRNELQSSMRKRNSTEASPRGGTSSSFRKQSVATSEDSSGLGETGPASSGDIRRKELAHSSDDDDDLKIDDSEEAAKQEERRAALMAQVLRAEAARKEKKEDDKKAPAKVSDSEFQAMLNKRRSTVALEGSLSLREGSGNFGSGDLASPTEAQPAAEDAENDDDLAAHAIEVIEDEIREEREKLTEKQADVDLAINIWTKRTVNQFLMIGGFIGFAALGTSLLGILAASEDVFISTEAPKTANAQLAGFITWDLFAQACVCNVVRNPSSLNGRTSAYPTFEQWVCDNNRRVERPRERVTATGTVVNGYPMRPLCGGFFNLGCGVTYNRDASVTYACPANVTTLFPGVDQTLW